MRIVEVNSKQDLKKFINFPNHLFKGNIWYVPPIFKDEWGTLNQKKNPAMKYCASKLFLAISNDKVVGRICGIINFQEAERKGETRGRFGWFDFIEDQDVARELLIRVESWLRDQGAESVEGPMGFTNLDKVGWLVEGFEEMPTIATLYNHAYYIDFIRNLGYSTEAKYIEFEFDVPKSIPDRIKKMQDVIKKRYKVETVKLKSKKQTLKYAYKVFNLLNETHKDLHGFIPFSENQIDDYVKKYIHLIKRDFLSLIVNKQDDLLGFAITMPSFSRAFQKMKGKLWPFGILQIRKAIKKNDYADLYLIGIADSMRNKGLNALIFSEIIENMGKHGVKKVDSNPELVENKNVQQLWKGYSYRQHKKRETFSKKLM